MKQEADRTVDERVLTRLGRWREKLLDLGKRNQLINFKARRTSTVQIVDELPSEVFRRLVIQGKRMAFAATEESEDQGSDENGNSNPIDAETFEAYEVEDLHSRHVDDLLQTTLVAEKLAKNLLYIERQAASALEEQGYNILYLALGMLEWYEAKASDVLLRSPLILIPVQLKRDGASKPFQLFPYEDEPIVNPGLARRLELDFGITLGAIPDDLESWDPHTIFAELASKCAAIDSRFRVTSEIYLGIFSFSKYLMYKDIEAHADAFAAAPLISQISGGAGAGGSEDPFAGVENLDPMLPPETTFQILDADSSQQAAILRVKAGQSLVIEGPPGTGKSQTIANIIAETLAAGQTVLFVSEKMAALEVVFRRLQLSGLGDFCLELHSRKANKREIAQELGRCLDLQVGPARARPDDHRRLKQLREELAGYANDIHSPVGAMELTPFELYGRLSRMIDVPALTTDLSDILEWTQEDFDEVALMLTRLRTALERVGDPSTHPWRGSILSEVSHQVTVRVPRLLDSLRQTIERAGSAGSALADLCRVPSARTLSDIGELAEFARVLANAPVSTPADLLLSTDWNVLPQTAASALRDGERYAALMPQVVNRFKESILSEDVDSLVKGQRSYGRNPFRFLSVRFRTDRRLLKAHIQDNYKVAAKSLLADLERALDAKQLREGLDHNPTAARLFGTSWHGRMSDWPELRELACWLVRYRQMLLSNAAREPSATLFQEGEVDRARLSAVSEEVSDALELLQSTWWEFAGSTEMDVITCLGQGFEAIEVEALNSRVKEMSFAIHELESWSSYVAESRIVDEAGYAGFVEELSSITDGVSAYLVPAFKKLFYSLLLEAGLHDRPNLKRFDGLAHQHAVAEFRRLDNLQLETSREQIREILANRVPDFAVSMSAQSEAGIIKREAKKQRRHLPVRRLFEQASGAILRLKPCLLMSPLSVAQFLDPSKVAFDLVIFDEASQVAPEDAIGAIARGKQLVVVGDSKQLPPTDFFQRQVDDEPEDEEDDLPADLQSILDECATIMPGTMLRWHYRSAHESLIAFSNRHFYAGGLHTFPSPVDDPSSLGVSFNLVKEGVYDAGKSRTNRVEAKRAAEYLVHVLRSEPELSVGVGTFSQAQQTAVLDELESYRREDPAIDARFNYSDPEHVFVKNLENIQGDERDVIIISIGYGRDELGRFSHNFGPLNAAGGDRRLNVLVTRARQRLAVFSSITSDDIDLGRTQSLGASLLKRYLAFAERGDPALFDVASAEMNFSDSDFEDAVFRALVQRGLDVRKQVGCSNYRIDLAVVDREKSGRYLLGIECDGASYHSSRTSRDRDRLRQQVLEHLGWTIHRIWSTDWFRNPNREIERVLEALRSAKPPVSTRSIPRPAPVAAVEQPMQEAMPREPRSNGDRFKVADYVVHPVRMMGRPEDFYVAPLGTLKSVLVNVVETEGPIHKIEAVRRVASHWTLSKAGKRIVERMTHAIDASVRAGTIRKQGQFLWPSGMKAPPVRLRSSDEAPLVADLIAPEEIAAAMVLVLRNELGLPEVELLRQTSRLLGFKAMSEQIRLAMCSGLELLLAKGHAVRNADRIRLPE